MTGANSSDKAGGKAGDKAGETAEPMRHPYGPRPVSALLPGLLRPAFKRRSPAAAQVVADWDVIVGPGIAAVTTPRRLFSGTLTIGCSGPMALELQHLADVLMARINTHLGQVVVTRLRFTQSLAAPPAVTPPPPARALAAAAAAVSELPPGPLRDALERLGRVVLTPLRPPNA